MTRATVWKRIKQGKQTETLIPIKKKFLMLKQKERKKYTQRDMRRQDNMLSYNIRLGCYGKRCKSIMWLYNATELPSLKMVKMVNFVIYVLWQKKKCVNFYVVW